MFFLCDLWPLCDFRYDIDSKSPDLAKHVSEKPFFFFFYSGSGVRLCIWPYNEFDCMFPPCRFYANQSLWHLNAQIYFDTKSELLLNRAKCCLCFPYSPPASLFVKWCILFLQSLNNNQSVICIWHTLITLLFKMRNEELHIIIKAFQHISPCALWCCLQLKFAFPRQRTVLQNITFIFI